MKKILKTGLTLTGLAALVGGFAWTRTEIVKVDEAFEDNPTYAVHRRYNMIDSSLKEAQDLLEYTPREEDNYLIFPMVKSENFPNPGIARLNLEGALMWYMTVPERGEEDFTLMTDIMDVREDLPDDVEIKIYEGERVDNDTFAEQRLAIEEVRSDVQEIADVYRESALLERGVDPDYSDGWTGMYVTYAGGLAFLIGICSSREKKKKDEKKDE